MGQARQFTVIDSQESAHTGQIPILNKEFPDFPEAFLGARYGISYNLLSAKLPLEFQSVGAVGSIDDQTA